jgi:hypothetical protein
VYATRFSAYIINSTNWFDKGGQSPPRAVAPRKKKKWLDLKNIYIWNKFYRKTKDNFLRNWKELWEYRTYTIKESSRKVISTAILSPKMTSTCLFAGFLLNLFLRPWRWRRYVPPKRRLTLNGLYGVVCQKMILFITTAVKTSNPTEEHKIGVIYDEKGRY